MTNTFIVILPDKFFVFTRTETRLYDITDCKQPITDNQYGISYNGVLPSAKQVANEYVADLLSKGAIVVFSDKKRKRIAKRRATSKSSRILREEAV